MMQDFYNKAGSLISPGDIFGELPYIRVPKPLRVARKFPGSLPKGIRLQGDLHEIFEYGKHSPSPAFNFDPPGEDVLSNAKMSKAIFLTWGSEVEGDERSGQLHKKEWLIAPVFHLGQLAGRTVYDEKTGQQVNLVNAIRDGKSPKYFPLQPLPGDADPHGYYVDFRRLCPLAATHFQGAARTWRLSPPALNDFYHQLIWFFTRREIFFRPITCQGCGGTVDLGIVFQGQAVDPEG